MYYIGIDISRNTLDFAVFDRSKFLFHKTISNTTSEIEDFIVQLQGLPNFLFNKALFCMENTGIYCNHVTETLTRFRTNIVKESPLHIHLSLGLTRGKDDKIDAIRIAKYAYRHRHELKPQSARRLIIEQLGHLMALRRRLKETVLKLRTPIGEQEKFVNSIIVTSVRQHCTFTIKAAQLDLAALDKSVMELVRSDTNVSRMFDIVTSVPAVGWITAVNLIITTNEMKQFNTVKRFACYIGIAPFKRESGVRKRRMLLSHAANKNMKTLIHLCTLQAIRRNATLRAYYIRKTEEEKKPKLTAINAVRNKLVAIIFACLREDRFFKASHEVISDFQSSFESSAQQDHNLIVNVMNEVTLNIG